MGVESMNLLRKSKKPFVSGDPFTNIIVGKLGANIWLVAIVFALIVNIPLLLLAMENNALTSRANPLGLVQDFGWWINQLLVVPATIVFFFWMPEGINNVVNGLIKNGVLRIPENKRNVLVIFYLDSIGYIHIGFGL
jgi:hypothetical protein